MSEGSYPTALFLRLPQNVSSGYNGVRTIFEYSKFCSAQGSAWLGTDALSGGMAPEKLAEFKSAFDEGQTVEIYFALGRTDRGAFDIEYRAQILNIESDSKKIKTPDNMLTPPEWQKDKRYVWLQITGIEATHLSTNDFRVVSSGNILTISMADSPYYFGYIKKI